MNNLKKALVLGLAVAACTLALPRTAKAVEPIDLNTYLMENTVTSENPQTGAISRSLEIDRSLVNEHKIQGYMSYTLASGRTIKMYIGEHAPLRAYITVVALPNGVEDTYAFLEEQGWIELADANGEMIFVLEPQDGVWGTPEEEASYLFDTIAENIGNNAFGLRQSTAGGIVTRGSFDVEDGTRVSVFTGHSTNYYVGYGEGCAVLESWTSNNPKYVAAQAFIGGESVGEEILQKNAATTYNGFNTGSYYPGMDELTFRMDLLKLMMDGAISSKDFLTNADIAVPTLFAGYAADDVSVAYWKGVNDCVEEAEDGVYHQAADSDAWQTDYNNTLAAEMGSAYGISEVVVKEEAEMAAADIRAFVSQYTRYTTPSAYSNALGMRTDYYPVAKAARTAAESGEAIQTIAYASVEGDEKEAEIRALESAPLTVSLLDYTAGNVYDLVLAFNDYDEDGVKDPREVILYVPEKAKEYGEKGAPIVMVYPGMTQAACTFFDCTMWWHMANMDGCVIAIIGEYTASNPASLIYGSNEDSANMTRATIQILDKVVSEKEGVKMDLTRVYGSGHSLGSRLSQTLTHTTESGYYAAVGSTSFTNTDFSGENGMPSMVSIGQADLNFILTEPWVEDAATGNSTYNWVKNCLAYNGVTLEFEDNVKESFLATCLAWTEEGRYHSYCWADADNADVPVVQFNRTIAREHNSMPIEARFAWEFVKHYSLKDGSRWYSPSAFAEEGDEVHIIQSAADIH